MYKFCINFVVGYIWVCTVGTPFDCDYIGFHTLKYIREICAHFLNDDAHLFPNSKQFEHTGYILFVFHVKSVLIRSVHHFWPKMSDSTQSVHKRATVLKTPPVCAHRTHCAHFLYFLYTLAMSTPCTPCTPRAHHAHWQHIV